MRLKPPSMYELRVPLLKKEVANTLRQLADHKSEWASKGCSIMSDGWRDSVMEKYIINFLDNSPKGSIFINSKDVSAHVKSATLLFELLDDMVEQVGEANDVHVVTDNASNYIKAGKIYRFYLLYYLIYFRKYKRNEHNIYFHEFNSGKLLEEKRPNIYWTPCAAH